MHALTGALFLALILGASWPVLSLPDTTLSPNRTSSGKGDSHGAACQGWDHIEPVWGIYSNSSLMDTEVHPGDVLVHGADYGANATVEGPWLFRTLTSMPDSKTMDGGWVDRRTLC